MEERDRLTVLETAMAFEHVVPGIHLGLIPIRSLPSLIPSISFTHHIVSFPDYHPPPHFQVSFPGFPPATTQPHSQIPSTSLVITCTLSILLMENSLKMRLVCISMVLTSVSLCRSCPGCFLANSLMTSGVWKASLMAAWMACGREQ